MASHVLDAHNGDVEAGVSFYLESGGVGHGSAFGVVPEALPAQASPRSIPIEVGRLKRGTGQGQASESAGPSTVPHLCYSFRPSPQVMDSEEEAEQPSSSPPGSQGARPPGRIRRCRPGRAGQADPDLERVRGQWSSSEGSSPPRPQRRSSSRRQQPAVVSDSGGDSEGSEGSGSAPRRRGARRQRHSAPLSRAARLEARNEARRLQEEADSGFEVLSSEDEAEGRDPGALEGVDVEEQRMLLAAATGEAYSAPSWRVRGRTAWDPAAHEARVLRSEQDAAYRASLEADRRRAREAEEEEARREREEGERREREVREHQEREDARRRRLERLANEPDKGEGVATIMIRLPSGSRCTRRFRGLDSAQVSWLEKAGEGVGTRGTLIVLMRWARP